MRLLDGRFWSWLVLVVAFALPSTDGGDARQLMGTLALFWAPGHLLLAALGHRLEPSPDGLGWAAFSALAIGLSMVTIALFGLGALSLGVALTATATKLTFAMLATGLFALSYTRNNHRVMPTGSTAPIAARLKLILERAKEASKQETVWAACMCIVVASATVVTLQPLFSSIDPEPFTELYFSTDHGSHCLPIYWDGNYSAMGDGCPTGASEVIVHVVNHEGRSRDYWLRALWLDASTDSGPGGHAEAVEWNSTGAQAIRLLALPPAIESASPRTQFEWQLELPDSLPPGLHRLSVGLFDANPSTSAAQEVEPLQEVYLWITAAP